MKEKAKKIFGYSLLVICLVYVLGTGIRDLCNQKDKYTVVIVEAVEIMQLEHSINGIIPIGTDHYYVGQAENTEDLYLIHAPKNWANKNFPNKGSGNPLKITGLAKKISDYDVRKEIQSRVIGLEAFSFPIGTQKCLELSYKRDAYMKIGSVLLLLVLAMVGILRKNLLFSGSTLSKIYIIAILVDIIWLLVAII